MPEKGSPRLIVIAFLLNLHSFLSELTPSHDPFPQTGPRKPREYSLMIAIVSIVWYEYAFSR
jgi:hypothetical protein